MHEQLAEANDVRVKGVLSGQQKMWRRNTAPPPSKYLYEPDMISTYTSAVLSCGMWRKMPPPIGPLPRRTSAAGLTSNSLKD